MQMKIQAQVMGAKKFSGQIDGKNFDYCRIIVVTPMDSTQGNAVGMSANEYDFGPSSNYNRFQQQQFPFEAELTIELVTNGKTQKLKVVDLKAINNKA